MWSMIWSWIGRLGISEILSSKKWTITIIVVALTILAIVFRAYVSDLAVTVLNDATIIIVTALVMNGLEKIAILKFKEPPDEKK